MVGHVARLDQAGALRSQPPANANCRAVMQRVWTSGNSSAVPFCSLSEDSRTGRAGRLACVPQSPPPLLHGPTHRRLTPRSRAHGGRNCPLDAEEMTTSFQAPLYPRQLLQILAAQELFELWEGGRPAVRWAARAGLARSERFELPTLGIEIRCSIQLSYERVWVDYQTWLARASSPGACPPMRCPRRLPPLFRPQKQGCRRRSWPI